MSLQNDEQNSSSNHKAALAINDVVLDVGGGCSGMDETLRAALVKRLFWTTVPWTPNGRPQRILPALFFMDSTGYSLWEQINRLPTYYQTNHEIDMFRRNSSELVDTIAPGTLLIDLGCG
ncbi:hypothetical protein MRB53_042333 [Persea americana]|nr:hypothetical protein MRB53_042333 [Persea americana]